VSQASLSTQFLDGFFLDLAIFQVGELEGVRAMVSAATIKPGDTVRDKHLKLKRKRKRKRGHH
jgi:hypothetical protein